MRDLNTIYSNSKPQIIDTFLPELLKLGTAYLAMDIPQKIMLTIPENSRASAMRYETHGTINNIRYSSYSIVSWVSSHFFLRIYLLSVCLHKHLRLL